MCNAGSEALPVNNSGTSFLIFGFSDPHGLEGREGTEDRTSDPDQEFTLSRSNDLDLHS